MSLPPQEDSRQERMFAMFNKLRILRILCCSSLNFHQLERGFSTYISREGSPLIVYELHLHALSIDLRNRSTHQSTTTDPTSAAIDSCSTVASSSTAVAAALKVLAIRILLPGQSENLLLWLCGRSSTAATTSSSATAVLPHENQLDSAGEIEVVPPAAEGGEDVEERGRVEPFLPSCMLSVNSSLLELHLCDSVDFSNAHAGLVLSLCTQLLELDVAQCGLLTGIDPLVDICCCHAQIAVRRVVMGTGFVFGDVSCRNRNCHSRKLSSRCSGHSMLKLCKLKVRNCCLFQFDCFGDAGADVDADTDAGVPATNVLGTAATATATIGGGGPCQLPLMHQLLASQLCYLRELVLSGSAVTPVQVANILQVHRPIAGTTASTATATCCNGAGRGGYSACFFPYLQRLELARCLDLEGTLCLEAHSAQTELKEIDLSGCVRLTHLFVDVPSLSSLTLTGLASLVGLYVSSDALRELNLRVLSELQVVQLGACPRLRRVDLTGSGMARRGTGSLSWTGTGTARGTGSGRGTGLRGTGSLLTPKAVDLFRSFDRWLGRQGESQSEGEDSQFMSAGYILQALILPIYRHPADPSGGGSSSSIVCSSSGSSSGSCGLGVGGCELPVELLSGKRRALVEVARACIESLQQPLQQHQLHSQWGDEAGGDVCDVEDRDSSRVAAAVVDMHALQWKLLFRTATATTNDNDEEAAEVATSLRTIVGMEPPPLPS